MIKINADSISVQVAEWLAMKRNQESVEGAAQAMITRLVRLQQADRHISTWAGCIADQSINDDERNRMLTTFRGQLKRGAEGADGERGAIKREKMAQFPTVKFKAESYAVAWKDWPQDDELKKQIRKELNAYLKDGKPAELADLLSSLAAFGKVQTEDMLVQQQKIVEAAQAEATLRASADDMLTDALDHVTEGHDLDALKVA